MISNELKFALMVGTFAFLWGFARWQPIILTKDGDEPLFSGWSFPVKYIKPIFNFYYEHYGVVGSLYLAYMECFVWAPLMVYISLMILKLLGYSLSLQGKTTNINFIEVIVFFVLVMIPNWLFRYAIPHKKKHQITHNDIFGKHPRAPWSSPMGPL